MLHIQKQLAKKPNQVSNVLPVYCSISVSVIWPVHQRHPPPTNLTLSQHILLACLTPNVYLPLKMAAHDGGLAYPASIWSDGCARPHKFKLDAICTNRNNASPVWGCERVRSQ